MIGAASMLALAVVMAAADRKDEANARAFGAALVASSEATVAVFSALEEALAGAGTACAQTEAGAQAVLRSHGKRALAKAEQIGAAARKLTRQRRAEASAAVEARIAPNRTAFAQRRSHVLETLGYFRTNCPKHARRLRAELDDFLAGLARRVAAAETAAEPAKATSKKRRRR